MNPVAWYVCIGLLLIIMTMITASLKRWPLTSAILYLGVGFLLGPKVVGLIRLDPIQHAWFIEHIAEVAVIISLFTAGLKLRLPLAAPEWRVPLLLASISMFVTIALIAMAGSLLLNLPLGAALLLGAILAPTDPVLAASVQVLGPEDQDRLRFSLTGEAGLNDGAAFPFVMLGLGLLGLRKMGDYGWRWIVFDVIWATAAGLAIGTLLATGVSKLILYLRRKHGETESLDDFLALGLICLTYGLALWVGSYGFLAVFAAGLALRRGERMETQGLDFVDDADEFGPRWKTASAQMARAVLTFNEQLERLGEVIVVLIVGAMFTREYISWRYLWIPLALFLLIRPISVMLGAPTRERTHTLLLSWFGIRGIGSLYYLAFAIGQGIPQELAAELTRVTLMVITASILIHGVSSGPLMLRYKGT